MRGNPLLATLLLAAQMSVGAPMVVTLKDEDDDIGRLKLAEALRHERLGNRVSDAQKVSEKLGRPQPRRNVPAGINRHTGEPHQHSREIARRLRQKRTVTA